MATRKKIPLIPTDATLTIGAAKTLSTSVNFDVSGADVTVVGSGVAVVTFPASTSTLATLALTETLTNKTLTSPKINEAVALTATATELNVLDGIPATLTATELGYVDGVTSAIQTQLNAKLTSANIVATITNGVTDKAPSEDAVYDALVLKAPIAAPTFTGLVTAPTGILNFLFNAPEGTMYNGRILPTVDGSGNLTVALKTLAGTDPSATDPVYVMIGGVVRSITGALSKTVNAAANTFNAGSAELATKEVDYPTLLSYNATDGVVLAFSRYFGSIYSDFSATAANEKYIACSGTNMAAGDPFYVIGRFAATLSAGAGYTWSVPTFTASNLIQKPVYEGMPQRLIVPTVSFSGTGPSGAVTSNFVYQVIGRKVFFEYYAHNYATPGSGTTAVVASLPFAGLYRKNVVAHCSVGGNPNPSFGNINYFNGGTVDIECTAVNATAWFVSGNYDI